MLVLRFKKKKSSTVELANWGSGTEPYYPLVKRCGEKLMLSAVEKQGGLSQWQLPLLYLCSESGILSFAHENVKMIKKYYFSSRQNLSWRQLWKKTKSRHFFMHQFILLPNKLLLIWNQDFKIFLVVIDCNKKLLHGQIVGCSLLKENNYINSCLFWIIHCIMMVYGWTALWVNTGFRVCLYI